MNTPIVTSRAPITLIGGGAADVSDVHAARALAPRIVAADGGARLALAAGITPEAVIGDFDSLDSESRARLPATALHHSDDQNSTDFDKAMQAIRAPVVLGVGFMGLRVDHQLAAFSTLWRFADRPCVLLGAHEVVTLAPPRIEVATAPGDVVSLFPLGPVRGRSEGLTWPIDGLTLEPSGRIGTSNRATGRLALMVDAPGLLLILPRARLGALMSALSVSAPDPARWPVRA
ncbi:MAG: thiamine diphosphokinase [Rhodobacteraceae bacterium]|nr:thiamine diphosphokinase [Paracoccaceae bacterium]